MRIFILFIIITISFASNLNYTKKEIAQTKYYISTMNKKLDKLAYKIHLKEQILNKITQQINILNKKIPILENELQNSNQKLSNLQKLKNDYETKAKKIQNKINNFISENYFINTIKISNINDLINKEISKAILKKYSKKINILITQNKQILTQINKLNKSINAILQKKKNLNQKQYQLYKLLKEQKKELALLNNQKLKYKAKLESLIKKQKALQNQLVKLKIIRKKASIHISKAIIPNMNVRKLGSVYLIPRVATYRGPKTIPPVRGTVIKRFGSYIDPVYKIRIYNDSITIKPYKPNSVVRSILNGRVIYIGNTSNDKKIIIIKHKHDLFSIYANLSQISPILREGSYVKKGQIIARVKHTLEFEITYKERPINPMRVISLK